MPETRFRVYIAASLDGFIADAAGGVDWLTPFNADGEDYGYGDFIAGIDHIVMGRTTYDQVRGFGDWPYAGIRTTVLTGRPLDDPPADVKATADLDDLIARLRRERNDVWVLGGAQAIAGFLARDAVTTVELFVMPVLLAGGCRLFGETAAPRRLALDRIGRYDNGVVKLVYRPAPGGA